jgi:3-hydroxyisobutyrate dehydrogenase-like beta-hydroxyacid dehydrogenase
VKVRKVGVIGLGAMGAGIAQLCIEAGVDTAGREVTLELAETATITRTGTTLLTTNAQACSVATKPAYPGRRLSVAAGWLVIAEVC